jgi:aspartate aminotransferase/aminotransferase
LITSGVSGGLLLALLALLNPGETALVPDPYFVIYKELPTLLGAKIQFLDTYPDFLLKPEQVQKAIRPECKILFLNNPANPTGRILPRETLKQIAEVLKGSGIWVISDEIYDAFDFEGQHSFFGSLYEKTLTLGGFSKTAGMTGWRVGYAAGPKDVIETMIKVQQYTFVCAPSFAQYACLKALDLSLSDVRDAYRKKRDFVMHALQDHYTMQKPDGAFYIFMKHPQWDGTRLVQEALKKEVLLVPGSIFSTRNTHFRLSFANTDLLLQKGVDRLLELAKMGSNFMMKDS